MLYIRIEYKNLEFQFSSIQNDSILCDHRLKESLSEKVLEIPIIFLIPTTQEINCRNRSDHHHHDHQEKHIIRIIIIIFIIIITPILFLIQTTKSNYNHQEKHIIHHNYHNHQANAALRAARPSRIVGHGYSQAGTFWCVLNVPTNLL